MRRSDMNACSAAEAHVHRQPPNTSSILLFYVTFFFWKLLTRSQSYTRHRIRNTSVRCQQALNKMCYSSASRLTKLCLRVCGRVFSRPWERRANKNTLRSAWLRYVYAGIGCTLCREHESVRD